MEPSHNIYEIAKHMDVCQAESIIEAYKDRKIICFGGGTAAALLMEKVLYRYDVECFLDNNQKVQGTELMGVPICSPDCLKEKQKGTYLVLIVSKHYEVIGKQLKEYGLEENIDYINLFDTFRDYFYIGKFDGTVKKFLTFLEKSPKNMFEEKKVNQNNTSIAIIVNGIMEKYCFCYAIAQYLVLRKEGYQVSLVVDNLDEYSNYIYFEDYHKVVQVYLDYVMQFIENYFQISLDVYYVEAESKAAIDGTEEAEIKKLNRYVLRWLDSRYDESFLCQDARRESISYEILKNNYCSLKEFFQQHSFEVINVFSGIHKHRILYPYIGKQQTMRVSTYDGDVGIIGLYETDGVASHSGDILRMLKENWLTGEEKNNIVTLAEADFAKRSSSTVKDDGYHYQLVGKDETVTKGYDVIIPLNIAWDAAALNVDDVFEDYIEWLGETLSYLMEYTDATVMVREHPAQMKLADYKFDNLLQKVPMLQANRERIFFASASEPINTYQYLQMCRLVLPFTSTVGVEAVMMNIPIITHTKAYYGKLSFGNKVASKDAYYKKIQEALQGDLSVSEEQRKEAFLCYYLQMKHITSLSFTDGCGKWLEYSLDTILEWQDTKDIVDIIANNIPIIGKKLKRE